MSDSMYIAHHGIKGMKWGVRRYQNPDGSLTTEGREHYQKIASTPHLYVSASPYGLLNVKGKIKYRKQKKVVATYRDAIRKLNDDDKTDFGKDSELIRSYANSNAISLTDAKRRYDFVMEDYNKIKNSDVAKKYPHDSKTFGNLLESGGYANQKLSDDIERKSGSWYFGEAVKGSNFESAMKSYQRTKDSFRKANAVRQQNGTGYSWYSSGEKKKAQQKILDAVLKDLGMPVTQANRDAIEPTVFWD